MELGITNGWYQHQGSLAALHLALTRGLQIVQFVKIVQIMKIVQIVKILQQSGGRLQAAYFDNRLKSAKTLCSYLHLI